MARYQFAEKYLTKDSMENNIIYESIEKEKTKSNKIKI